MTLATKSNTSTQHGGGGNIRSRHSQIHVGPKAMEAINRNRRLDEDEKRTTPTLSISGTHDYFVTSLRNYSVACEMKLPRSKRTSYGSSTEVLDTLHIDLGKIVAG
jgi:hypothetical protein